MPYRIRFHSQEEPHLGALRVIKDVERGVVLRIDIVLIPGTIDHVLPVFGRVLFGSSNAWRHRVPHHLTTSGSGQLLGQGDA